MKKTFLLPLLFFGFMTSAQQVIVEEKFEKDNEPIGFHYYSISNKLLIEKGEKGTTRAEKMKDLYAFDSNGKKDILFEGDEVKDYWGMTENAFRVDKYHVNLGYAKGYKTYANGKLVSSSDRKDDTWTYFLTNSYEFSIKDKKGHTSNFDLEEDELFIFSRSIQTQKEQTIKIEPLNITRLLGDNLAPQNEGNRAMIKNKGFNYMINALTDDTFQIITKAITKDFTKVTTYRTIYNMDGKIIKDTAFEVSIPNYYAIKAAGVNNGGGMRFGFSLNFNGYYEDLSTGDMYFCGLFSNEKDQSDTMKNAGYYVMKFNSQGKKIWEYIKTLDNKRFSANVWAAKKGCYLEERSGKLVLNIYIDLEDQYMRKDIIDKNTGKSIEVKTLDFKEESYKYDYVSYNNPDFMKSVYSSKELKDKFFDSEGMYQLKFNPTFANYVKSVNSKKEVHFKMFNSITGFWLLETDNKNYYKILYFKE